MIVTVDTPLWNRATPSRGTLLLAHGAGAGMTNPFLEQIAERISEGGLSVARFEFAYMAARRGGGAKRPPPRADLLIDEYVRMLEMVSADVDDGPVLIGGKSMGGRVAAMVSAGTTATNRAAAVVCLGYPFHPPGKPERTRLEPLQQSGLPVLICQGDRDPFGSAADIDGYDLPDSVSVMYLEDGDHDFKPRGRSPATWKGNLNSAARTVCDFVGILAKE